MKSKTEILQILDNLRSEAVPRSDLAQAIQDAEQLVKERDYFVELSVELKIALLDAIYEIRPNLTAEEYVKELENFVNNAAAKPVIEHLTSWTMEGEVTDAGFKPKSK